MAPDRSKMLGACGAEIIADDGGLGNDLPATMDLTVENPEGIAFHPLTAITTELAEMIVEEGLQVRFIGETTAGAAEGVNLQYALFCPDDGEKVHPDCHDLGVYGGVGDPEDLHIDLMKLAQKTVRAREGTGGMKVERPC